MLILVEVGITQSLAEPQLYLTFYSAQIGQRETEEYNYTIFVKFSTIRKLGTENDDFGQPGKRSYYTISENLTTNHHIVIVFDLRVPPVFEGQGFNSQEPGDRQRKNHKTRDRLVALNDAHTHIVPYAPSPMYRPLRSSQSRNF
jgi:hypothetical protein